jgi:predicted nuclease with TOPRIM domain
MIVFQPNINKPTQELAAEVLKGMIEHPANIERDKFASGKDIETSDVQFLNAKDALPVAFGR